MAGIMKRRHEGSSYGSVPALSEYSLHAAKHAANPSQDFLGLVDDRVNSPKNILDFGSFTVSHRDHSKRSLSFKHKEPAEETDWEQDEDAEKRVTIWNWREQRKLSGNSAPFKKNLKEYIRKHPDWEEYVGQDKDNNGKKLSPKKMKPPAPLNPNHPALRGDDSPPPSPSANRSGYSTRSSQPRQSVGQATSVSPKLQATPTEFLAPAAALTMDLDLDKPMPIIVEAPEAVAQRRAAEMASRREAVEATDDDDEQGDEMQKPKPSEVDAAAAWTAAAKAVAQARAEKEAAQRKAAEETESARRLAHSVVQGNVADTAFERIQAFKRRRLK